MSQTSVENTFPRYTQTVEFFFFSFDSCSVSPQEAGLFFKRRGTPTERQLTSRRAQRWFLLLIRGRRMAFYISLSLHISLSLFRSHTHSFTLSLNAVTGLKSASVLFMAGPFLKIKFLSPLIPFLISNFFLVCS